MKKYTNLLWMQEAICHELGSHDTRLNTYRCDSLGEFWGQYMCRFDLVSVATVIGAVMGRQTIQHLRDLPSVHICTIVRLLRTLQLEHHPTNINMLYSGHETQTQINGKYLTIRVYL